MQGVNPLMNGKNHAMAHKYIQVAEAHRKRLEKLR